MFSWHGFVIFVKAVSYLPYDIGNEALYFADTLLFAVGFGILLNWLFFSFGNLYSFFQGDVLKKIYRKVEFEKEVRSEFGSVDRLREVILRLKKKKVPLSDKNIYRESEKLLSKYRTLTSLDNFAENNMEEKLADLIASGLSDLGVYFRVMLFSMIGSYILVSLFDTALTLPFMIIFAISVCYFVIIGSLLLFGVIDLGGLWIAVSNSGKLKWSGIYQLSKKDQSDLIFFLRKNNMLDWQNIRNVVCFFEK